MTEQHKNTNENLEFQNLFTSKWEALRGDISLLKLKEISLTVEDLATKANIDKSQYSILSDRDWFSRIFNRTTSSFTIIVIGQVSSGKSSFINSLFGRKLLKPASHPTDGVVSVFLPIPDDENEEFAEKVHNNGETFRFTNIDEALNFIRQPDQNCPNSRKESIEMQQLSCKEVRFYLNEPKLRKLRIVNTPGLGDRLQVFEKIALQYLNEDESDLVVWIFFPDTVSNDAEIGLFSNALFRRKNSVLGVVSRCLEGKAKDKTYDPSKDPNLIGDHGVVQWLKSNLGEYLKEIILYDSHYTRNLIKKMHEEPELQNDENFIEELNRSGYLNLHNALTSLLGENYDETLDARVKAIFNKCIGHAKQMEVVTKVVQQKFNILANESKEERDAWKKIEDENFKELRNHLRANIHTLAKEKSEELSGIISKCVETNINKNLNIIDSIIRKLLYRISPIDSPEKKIENLIRESIENNISKLQFNERMNSAYKQIVIEYVDEFHKHFSLLEKKINVDDSNFDKSRTIDYELTDDPSNILNKTFSTVLKAIITAVIKVLERNIESLVGKRLASVILKKVAVTSVSRIVSIVLIVQIPFIIDKISKDFKKDKKNMIKFMKSQIKIDQYLQEQIIFDTYWAEANEIHHSILSLARNEFYSKKCELKKILEHKHSAENCLIELQEILLEFQNRIDEVD